MDRADIRELIEKSNSDVMVSSINKTADNTSIDSFKIKSEVYTFDANVLSNKVKEYIGRLEKAKSENGYTAKLAKQQAEAEEEAKKKAAETKAPTAGSVFEFVNQLKQDYDSKIVEKALACACLAPLPPANAGQALAVALSDMGSADQLPYKNAYVKIEKDVNRNKTN
jgi:hypothetical protein